MFGHVKNVGTHSSILFHSFRIHLHTTSHTKISYCRDLNRWNLEYIVAHLHQLECRVNKARVGWIGMHQLYFSATTRLKEHLQQPQCRVNKARVGRIGMQQLYFSATTRLKEQGPP